VLSERVKHSLRLNWGDKAEAMDCFAEVKFIDESSDWQCYIYALDEDEDAIKCLIVHYPCSCLIVTWSLQELYSFYNTQGELPIVDSEYRRMKVSELYKRLI